MCLTFRFYLHITELLLCNQHNYMYIVKTEWFFKPLLIGCSMFSGAQLHAPDRLSPTPTPLKQTVMILFENLVMGGETRVKEYVVGGLNLGVWTTELANNIMPIQGGWGKTPTPPPAPPLKETLGCVQDYS